MARAMRASGERNPKAMRVRSRILVLVDSISPLDRPWSKVASMAARCLTILRCSSTKAGMRQRRAQLVQASSASLPASPLTANDVAKSLLEQVGAVEARVGLGDPGELGRLVLGQVLGVLPQGVAGPLDRARRPVGHAGPAAERIGAAPARGSVPGFAAHDVEGVGGPGHDVEGVGALDRVGQRSVTTRAIQGAASAETWVIPAQRSSPSRSKNLPRVASSRPAAAQTRRPVSWSTTTVK